MIGPDVDRRLLIIVNGRRFAIHSRQRILARPGADLNRGGSVLAAGGPVLVGMARGKHRVFVRRNRPAKRRSPRPYRPGFRDVTHVALLTDSLSVARGPRIR